MIEEKQLSITTPEEYAQIVKGRAELVPLPSGLVVRARRAKMEGMALKGGVPMSLLLAAGSLKAVTDGSSDPTPKQIEETDQGLKFFRELTRKNCLEPLIICDENGVAQWWEWPNQARLDIEDDDFEALAMWVRGEEIDSLDSFRSRTEGSASTGQPEREALQPEPVAVIEGQPA